jgi:hypothetical protein
MPTSEQVAWFMAAAARAGGRHLLAAAEDAGPATAEALGLRLLQQFSRGGAPDLGLPGPVSAVMASPYSREALTALEVHVGEVLDGDPALAAADEMLFIGKQRPPRPPSSGPSTPGTRGRYHKR